MLGIITIFVILFACVAKGISNYSYKVNAIKSSREDGNYETYVDINGMMRFQKNDKAISTHYDLKTGDLLSWNPETGEIYENVSKKERERLFREGLKRAEGKMVPCSAPGENLRSKSGKSIWGRKYFNLDNKCYYVKRYIQGTDVFLNCETNLYEIINCTELPPYCILHNDHRKKENFSRFSEIWDNEHAVGI